MPLAFKIAVLASALVAFLVFAGGAWFAINTQDGSTDDE